MSETQVNREYRDRLLNFVFGREENRRWTLQLYNAVNDSKYDDPDAIEFNTLKDVLYMGMKNDTSFLISDILNVYEHQSSYNPNMPLRMLQYLSDLYSAYIARNKLNKYSSSLISLPVPKLVVFYNGEKKIEDETILRLSDSFTDEHRKESDVEVKVRMININHGHSLKLMKACKPLEEYSWFINEINVNLAGQDERDIVAAVRAALNAMPGDYEIHDFLMTHKAEVEGMLDTEYNEAEVKELFIEEGRKEGIKEGADLKARDIAMRLLKKGSSPDSVSEDTGLTSDIVLQIMEDIAKEDN
ncbi:MAG: Rpn family recombination-promoting nuclease/putative transposase [Butyrivibrio sp.]|nr:Rpn family recombination-promoting nuclease/putative transposase [Butyrivibrio sp.]